MRDRIRDEHFTAIYSDLAEKFTVLVNVIAEIAEPMPGNRAVDLLAVYDRWTRGLA